MTHTPSFTAGETLTLSGKFAPGAGFEALVWTGAVATIFIYNEAGTAVVNGVSVAINTDSSGNHTYFYLGTMPPIGLYTYRIKVLFTDTSSLNFPRGSARERFRVVP